MLKMTTKQFSNPVVIFILVITSNELPHDLSNATFGKVNTLESLLSDLVIRPMLELKS